MGRGRKQGARTPTGQLSRAGQAAGATMAEALRAARIEPRFGSQAGIARMQGRLTEAQYEAARRVSATVADYRAALLISGVASPGMEVGRGAAPADPESDKGAHEARRHTAAVARYDRMRDRLALRGPAVAEATIKFATDEYCDWRATEWAKVGLDQLALDWRGGR
jgi:hypothetical protein